MTHDEKGLLSGSRIEIVIDGKIVLGTSVTKRPENKAALVAILKELIAAIEAPRVGDGREPL